MDKLYWLLVALNTAQWLNGSDAVKSIAKVIEQGPITS